MLEPFFRQVSYTWRNSDFFNDIHPSRTPDLAASSDQIGSLKRPQHTGLRVKPDYHVEGVGASAIPMQAGPFHPTYG